MLQLAMVAVLGATLWAPSGGKFAESEADYTAVIQQRPDVTDLYSLGAGVREARGDFGGAIDDYKKAAKLNRDPGKAAEIEHGLERATERLAWSTTLDGLSVKQLCNSWKLEAWDDDVAMLGAVAKRKLSKDDCVALLGDGN